MSPLSPPFSAAGRLSEERYFRDSSECSEGTKVHFLLKTVQCVGLQHPRAVENTTLTVNKQQNVVHIFVVI